MPAIKLTDSVLQLWRRSTTHTQLELEPQPEPQKPVVDRAGEGAGNDAADNDDDYVTWSRPISPIPTLIPLTSANSLADTLIPPLPSELLEKRTSSTWTCGICMDLNVKPTSRVSCPNKCDVCVSCVHAWINEQLGGEYGNLGQVTCPQCNHTLTYDDIDRMSKVVNDGTKEKYERRMVSAALGEDAIPCHKCDLVMFAEQSCRTTGRASCPNNCGTMLVMNDKKFSLAGTWVNLKTSIWAMCNTKNCPECGVAIQKNGGCPSMHCTNCNAHFRWNNVINVSLFVAIMALFVLVREIACTVAQRPSQFLFHSAVQVLAFVLTRLWHAVVIFGVFGLGDWFVHESKTVFSDFRQRHAGGLLDRFLNTLDEEFGLPYHRTRQGMLIVTFAGLCQGLRLLNSLLTPVNVLTMVSTPFIWCWTAVQWLANIALIALPFVAHATKRRDQRRQQERRQEHIRQRIRGHQHDRSQRHVVVTHYRASLVLSWVLSLILNSWAPFSSLSTNFIDTMTVTDPLATATPFGAIYHWITSIPSYLPVLTEVLGIAAVVVALSSIVRRRRRIIRRARW